VILRRSGWPGRSWLDGLVERTAAAARQMPDDVVWIRSYVLEERDGSVGLMCVYCASGPEAIRRHAAAAELPVDEILKVADTVVVQPDSVSATS
jgi:Nickel responsive protein SCO4226-like